MALKRRSSDQSQNAARRIIAFVGSPVKESTKELVQLAKRLKKNNIAVDIINFGEVKLNTKKLEAFIDAVNSSEKNRFVNDCVNNNTVISNLVTIPPGPHVLSDILLTSPIVVGDQRQGASGAQGDFDFGPEAANDPELAMALRMSLEEERLRQEKLRKEREAAEKKAEEKKPEDKKTEEKKTEEKKPEPKPQELDIDAMDEDEQIRLAMELSLQQAQPKPEEQKPTEVKKEEEKKPEPKQEDQIMQDETYDDDLYGDEEEMDEEEQLKLALQLSKQQPQGEKKEENIKDIIKDEQFLNEVIGSLDGVNAEEVLKGEKSEEKKEEKKDEPKK